LRRTWNGAEPVPPRQRNPSVPRDLEVICLKCLSKEPDQRYGSAEAVAEDLERWLGGEPIHARPIGRVERVGKWAKRNPTVAVLGAAVLLAMLGGVGGILWYAREAVHQEGIARDRADDLEIALDAKNSALGQVTTERNRAEETAEKRREVLYVTRCNLAAATLRVGDYERVVALLKEMKPGPGERDLRSFEWHFLDRLVIGNRTVIHLEGAGAPAAPGDRTISHIFYTDDRH